MAELRSFPSDCDYWGWALNLCRRINEHAWTYASRNPSKLSMMRHLLDKHGGIQYRVTRLAGKVLAFLNLEQSWERCLRWLVLRKEGSAEAAQRFARRRPVFVLSMAPQLSQEPFVLNTAIRMGIPTGAFITSWDNLSTKNRLLHAHKCYFVWTSWMKEELEALEPRTAMKIHVVGAPQYDVALDDRYFVARDEFLISQRLRPELPVIVAALGMANGIDESYLAEGLARLVSNGELGEVQLLVRPHPFFHSDVTLKERLGKFGPRVSVQMRDDFALPRNERSVTRSDAIQWLNTFRHASVVVHLSSTVAVDAAIFDVPSVCLDFDPSPNGEKTELVKEVNRDWLHYRRVIATGGTRLAGNWEEVAEAIRLYLERPEQDRERRASMVELVAGQVDGKASERLARAVREECLAE